MRYLIIHNRYHRVSGPETYLFNLKKNLQSLGHSVDVFALNYEENLVSDNEQFFPNPIGSRTRYSLDGQKLSIRDKLKIIASIFYRHDVYKSLDKLLKLKKYDGAIILQFWGKLSPSIFRSLNKNKVPFVVRLSDYGLVCSKNTFYRNNSICTKCIDNPLSSIQNKCIDNSYVKSFLNFCGLISFSVISRMYKIKFIETNKFSKEIMQKSYFLRKNNHTNITTFSDHIQHTLNRSSYDQNNIKIIFFGRVSRDKGIDFLCKALSEVANVKINIKIIGHQDNAINEVIENIRFPECIDVQFIEFIEKDKLKQYLIESDYSIITSIWFDNLPNSLIESLSEGKPVIAPNHGCFSEFIKNNKNGFLFKPGNIGSLKSVLEKLNNISREEYLNLSNNSLKYSKKKFNPHTHIDSLIDTISIND